MFLVRFVKDRRERELPLNPGPQLADGVQRIWAEAALNMQTRRSALQVEARADLCSYNYNPNLCFIILTSADNCQFNALLLSGGSLLGPGRACCA